MRLRPSAALAAVVLSLVLPGVVVAQDRTPESVVRSTGRALPGSYNSSPTAYGTAGGDIFFGGEYESEARGIQRPDGNATFGVGLFNASNIAGVELSLTSLTTVNGFGDQVVGNLKLHKLFGGDLGLAIGVDGVKISQNDRSDLLADPSLYAAITKGMKFAGRTMFNELTIGAGVGNGKFQQFEDFAVGEDGVGFFVNSTLRANSWASLMLDYTGQDLNLGVRIQPSGELPIIITPVLYDVAGQAADKVRFGVSAAIVLW